MGLTFVDLFCGIGTIRMGMEQAGHTCTYSVEWDKHKRKIYSIIFGGEPEGADIREVRAIDIPVSDVWCFGAPCQDFSIAGKRAGMEGERSSLVLEVFRLIRETPEEDRPKYLIYENVKGMLGSAGGADFLEVLYQMDQLGYDTEWQNINSRWYIPQNRERIITIGHFRGQSTGKVFPIGEITGLSRESPLAKETQVANCLRAKFGGPDIDETYIQVRERWRVLTPKERWRLQGISDVITDNVIHASISKTQMNHAAGDACSVPVVYEIGKKLT